MRQERFETRLTPAEAAHVHREMARLGTRSRATYLRDCLLAGRTGHAEQLASLLGQNGMLLNELVRRVDAASGQPFEPLIGEVARRLRAIDRWLQNGGA